MNPAEFHNIAALEESFWWFEGMRRMTTELLDSMLKIQTFSQVLEVGCGTGHMARYLHRQRQLNVHCIDLAQEGLRYAQSAGTERLVQGDMRALPYAGQSFEAVISLDVLVHLEKNSEEHALREFARVLRPAGLLLLRVSALNVLRSRHSAFAHERQRFTRDRLAKSLRKVGLTPLRMTYANTLLLPVALLKFRILEPLMGAADESGVRPIPRWLNRSLQAVLQCETAWIASGRNFPLGQSLFAICRKDVG